MTLAAAKHEAKKQWDTDPCGAETVNERQAADIEFYRAIRRHRYGIYGPWFDAVVRFGHWHDCDILEIGVGLGSDHVRFAEHDNRMVALDLSCEHLRHTRRHLQLEGLEGYAIVADAEQMPLCGARFDLVYAFGVLHHTPAIDAAIAEIHRVLRPGGTAIVALYHRNSWFFWINKMLADGILKGGLPRKGYRRLMSEVEFRRTSDSAMPLVKTYSRKQARRLFRAFKNVNIVTCHVEASHFWRFQRVIGHWTRDALETRLGRGGWYLLIRADK